MNCPPVLFLVFNRPDTTARVFEAIRTARPERLYVAADGPRPDRPGEAERCAEIRQIATAVNWPCEVRTLFRDRNLGCGEAVSGAIRWFFDNEEEGMILEDDCLPSSDFFNSVPSSLNASDTSRKSWRYAGPVMLNRTRTIARATILDITPTPGVGRRGDALGGCMMESWRLGRRLERQDG